MADTQSITDVLDRSGWTHTSSLALLDLDVTVYSDEPEVVLLVQELFAPLATTRPAQRVLSMGSATVEDRPGYCVALDGVVIARTTAPSVAFTHLLFDTNRLAIENAVGPVVLHAAGAVAGDIAIALPGPMDAGKSTLVAGLVANGLSYLTDELVAIDSATTHCRPYAKAISLGVSPDELARLRWDAPGQWVEYLAMSGLVPVRSIRSDVVATATKLGLVVLPRYESSASTEVTRLDLSDALMSVAAHAFHLERPGTLRALSDALEGIPCYRLVSGHLDEAVAAVLDLADTSARV